MHGKSTESTPFVSQAGVNLESDMLSTPDFFWDNDEWEPVYKHALKYLEVDNRVIILNKRMEVLSEMFEMLRNQLEVGTVCLLETSSLTSISLFKDNV